MGDRRSVRWRDMGHHADLIVWVEVELAAVVSDLSVLGLPVLERDSVKVTEKDA